MSICGYLIIAGSVCFFIFSGLNIIHKKEIHGTMSYRGTWYGLQGQDAVAFGRSMVVGGLCVPIAAFLGLFSDRCALPFVLICIAAFARVAYIGKTRIGPIRRD